MQSNRSRRSRARPSLFFSADLRVPAELVGPSEEKSAARTDRIVSDGAACPRLRAASRISTDAASFDNRRTRLDILGEGAYLARPRTSTGQGRSGSDDPEEAPPPRPGSGQPRSHRAGDAGERRAGGAAGGGAQAG